MLAEETELTVDPATGKYVVDETEKDLRELLGDESNCSVILDRKTMGMTVNVSYAKDQKLLLLEAETNACHKIAVIPPDKVFHAFYHPCMYVANPSDLFPKSKSL